jgi:hypothetical protein
MKKTTNVSELKSMAEVRLLFQGAKSFSRFRIRAIARVSGRPLSTDSADFRRKQMNQESRKIVKSLTR